MLTDAEVQARLENAPAPRVTEGGLVAEIYEVAYLRHDLTTICIITARNGFKFVGHSTPAYADNFDPKIGEKYAYDNAFKQMWPMYGFLLKQTAYECS